MAGPILVLGPQRPTPNLAEALATLGEIRNVAVITCGWRHDEDQLEPLISHLGDRHVVHVPLYRWFEQTMETHDALRERYRARQARIVAYKQVHRLRLHGALWVAAQLQERTHDRPVLYTEDFLDAIHDLRRLDALLLDRVGRITQGFADVDALAEVPDIIRRRDQFREIVRRVDAVLIAGGHVAVLRNRLKLYGAHEVLADTDKPIIAWSAGAMALTERIVLYYDDPPEGYGEAEVLHHGFGLLPGVVLLPHARNRLDLTNTAKVQVFAERFAPSRCIGLEPGAFLRFDGSWSNLSPDDATFALGTDGTVQTLGGAW